MENQIKVDYDDFVLYAMRSEDLESIRILVKSGVGYCSDDIKAILGLPVKSKEGTQNGGND